MKIGLYEEIVNLVLSKKIADDNYTSDCKPLEVVDSHKHLAQYIFKVLAQGLSQVKSVQSLTKDRDKKESKLSQQVLICNEIIDVLKANKIDGFEDYKISEPAKQLISLLENIPNKKTAERPETPLAWGSLLTGTRLDPSLVSQVKKEISTANKIDMLVSFIKWSGIMLMKEQLEDFTKVEGNQLRIITTSYMGATDLKAIKYLETLPNTEVKISYDTHRTRLHAKAYSFYRNTGFSSAYVGSANLSQAAFTDGLEWTVKISQYEQPYQWQKITATFDTYWNDSEFETFRAEDKERLERALQSESVNTINEFQLPNFDIRPYGFQQEILAQIQVERELQDINKHLIVAATGTGKTMIAAFDFKQWRSDFKNKNDNREPKILFIAHRKEILEQSLYTFRAVLRDQNFGSLMVGGYSPNQLDQLFISIQTYNSKEFTERFDPSFYDYVVVDEFHHGSATSYQALLNHVNPKSLLGLTATPERADGQNILIYFNDHVTAEIRLPDAINRKLLCPFHYYGISDVTDFSNIKWSRGGYDKEQISNVLSNNDSRVNLIIQKASETVLNINDVRGLGFCVSKAHAEFMSDKFNKYGIKSEFLTADTGSDIRQAIKQKLVDKVINFIFVVDLYNEGVDIPEVDTVLFLRPTESLTVFLQQLGRGLRLNDDKDHLTVLDFVGQAHKNFRYDLRFLALIGNSNKRIDDELNEGFPHLPAGCSIQLERQAKERILKNIKESFNNNRLRIIEKIRRFTGDTGIKLTLANFLEYYRMNPDDIYKRASWSRLCSIAGENTDFNDPDEAQLTKGFRRLLHINDYEFINNILKWLDNSFDEKNLSANEIKQLTMLHFTLWNKTFKVVNVSGSFKRLDGNPILKNELIELLNLCKNSILSVTEKIDLPFETPLRLHGRYTREEILVGLGKSTLDHQHVSREGSVQIQELDTDIFFITLNKSEKHYSPTTLYEDYAISNRLFHWQSQSTTSNTSPTGKRYIGHDEDKRTIMLFVREQNKIGAGGLAEPFYFLGPVKYVSHEGSKPISFIWELDYPMPAHLVREAAHLSIA
jgi:superfamily II DNA or RNA helicase